VAKQTQFLYILLRNKVNLLRLKTIFVGTIFFITLIVFGALVKPLSRDEFD